MHYLEHIKAAAADALARGMSDLAAELEAIAERLSPVVADDSGNQTPPPPPPSKN